MSTTAADTLKATIPFLTVISQAVETQVRTSPEVAGKIKTALDSVQQGVQALAASETVAESAPIVDRIAMDAQAILAVGASLPLPPPANLAFMIASMVFPAAMAGVKLMLSHHAPMAPAPTG